MGLFSCRCEHNKYPQGNILANLLWQRNTIIECFKMTVATRFWPHRFDFSFLFFWGGGGYFWRENSLTLLMCLKTVRAVLSRSGILFWRFSSVTVLTKSDVTAETVRKGKIILSLTWKITFFFQIIKIWNECSRLTSSLHWAKLCPVITGFVHLFLSVNYLITRAGFGKVYNSLLILFEFNSCCGRWKWGDMIS